MFWIHLIELNFHELARRETDSKVDFRKKSGKKKKDKSSGLSEHFKKKRHQLDWNSIKILAKENNYWKRRSKEAYFITSGFIAAAQLLAYN